VRPRDSRGRPATRWRIYEAGVLVPAAGGPVLVGPPDSTTLGPTLAGWTRLGTVIARTRAEAQALAGPGRLVARARGRQTGGPGERDR